MDAVVDWLVGLMRTIGAPGVGVATLLETVVPPVPSEIVLPLAGFTAQRGHYSLTAAILWATAGSVLGAWLLHGLGRRWGLARLRATAGRIPLMKVEDVDRAMAWFDRHGRSAVLVGRLVPGVRSLVSIPAGVHRMPVPTFLLWTTIGSLGWNGLLIGLGYALGSQWHLVEQHAGTASTLVWTLIGLAAAWLVVHRLRGRRRH